MRSNNIMNFLKSSTGKMVMIIVLYLIFFAVEYFLLTAFNNQSFVFVCLAISMAYFGWRALSRITINLFIIMPISAWLWYILIKGILSIFVGAFVAPYQIAKIITSRI